VSHTSESKTGN